MAEKFPKFKPAMRGEIVMGTEVATDLYYDLDGQLLTIKEQLRKKGGYRFDPLQLADHLYAAIEGRFMSRDGRPLLVEPVFSPIPGDGEEFELILRDKVDPMEMVRNSGCDPDDWKFRGEQIIVPSIHHFKLVQVGYCRDFTEVQDKLTSHGNPANGWWREVFQKTYPRSDGKGPIGFLDHSWIDPAGRTPFPGLVCSRGHGRHYWTPRFFYVQRLRSYNWRWLVEVEE